MSYVQGKTHANGNNPSTTVATTLDAAVGAGDGLCVAIGWAGSSSDVGMTILVRDDQGNVYTVPEPPVFNTSSSYLLVLAYCRNLINAPRTITATLEVARSFATIIIDEYSELGAFDGAALNDQTAVPATADAVTSTAITSTADGDLVWGVGIDIFSNGFAFGTGFTGRQSLGGGTANTFYTEDRVQTSAGSIAATFTASSNDDTVAGVLAFMPVLHAGLGEAVGDVTIDAVGAVLVQASQTSTFDAIVITAAGTVTGNDLLTKVRAATGLGGVSPRRRRRHLYGGVELRLPGLWAAAAGEAGEPPKGEAALRCLPLELRALGDIGARGRVRLPSSRLELELAAALDVAPCGELAGDITARNWVFATGRHDHFTDSDILLLTRILIG